MRRQQKLVLALHADALFRAQLAKACRREGWALQLERDWLGLIEAGRSSPASALVVVDPYSPGSGAGKPLALELLALMNRFPSSTVVAALETLPGRLEDVRRLGEWGVSQVIELQTEATAMGIADRLRDARGKPLRNIIGRSLPPVTSGAARSILTAAAAVVIDGGQGTDLAKALHITPRTLLRWTRRAGLPAPRTLLAWMRMLLAAELLDDPGRTVSDAALSCGYSTDGALRQALKRFVEQTPSELRQAGAFESAAAGFLAALREAKSSRTRYRRASDQLRINGGDNVTPPPAAVSRFRS